MRFCRIDFAYAQTVTLGVAVSALALAIGSASRAGAAGPEVKSLLPAGGQRGATTEVTARGKFPKWPPLAWTDRPGVTVNVGADSGKLSVVVPADAAPGLVWLRLYDALGTSAPVPFVISTLAEIVEQEPNNRADNAQTVPTPTVVVNGQLSPSGDVDVFAIAVRKGQTLLAALEAHETLGSPVDSALQIVGPRGNMLTFNHDDLGLDPRVAFVAPADGTYLVRVFGFPAVPNSTIAFAGGEQYVYRLTLTTGGFIDYPWPLAATHGRETRVELVGWNIPDSLAAQLIHPEGQRADLFDPRLAGLATVAVEPHNTLVEIEPNVPATPQPIELPVTVSGRIGQPRDMDAFSFVGKQGQPLVFQVESRAWNNALDAVLEISDGAGKSLARVDDTGNTRDATLTFSPPADGLYRVAVSDLNRQGSPRHIYRLRATQAQPDFDVTADNHAYQLAAGKTTEITLAIDRRNGFAEEITFELVGAGELVAAAPAKSTPEGEAAKTVKLVLSAKPGTFSGPVRVVARSGGAHQVVRTATAVVPGNSARVSDLWLTVTNPPSP